MGIFRLNCIFGRRKILFYTGRSILYFLTGLKKKKKKTVHDRNIIRYHFSFICIPIRTNPFIIIVRVIAIRFCIYGRGYFFFFRREKVCGYGPEPAQNTVCGLAFITTLMPRKKIPPPPRTVTL